MSGTQDYEELIAQLHARAKHYGDSRLRAAQAIRNLVAEIGRLQYEGAQSRQTTCWECNFIERGECALERERLVRELAEAREINRVQRIFDNSNHKLIADLEAERDEARATVERAYRLGWADSQSGYYSEDSVDAGWADARSALSEDKGGSNAL